MPHCCTLAHFPGSLPVPARKKIKHQNKQTDKESGAKPEQGSALPLFELTLAGELLKWVVFPLFPCAASKRVPQKVIESRGAHLFALPKELGCSLVGQSLELGRTCPTASARKVSLINQVSPTKAMCCCLVCVVGRDWYRFSNMQASEQGPWPNGKSKHTLTVSSLYAQFALLCGVFTCRRLQ